MKTGEKPAGIQLCTYTLFSFNPLLHESLSFFGFLNVFIHLLQTCDFHKQCVEPAHAPAKALAHHAIQVVILGVNV